MRCRTTRDAGGETESGAARDQPCNSGTPQVENDPTGLSRTSRHMPTVKFPFRTNGRRRASTGNISAASRTRFGLHELRTPRLLATPSVEVAPLGHHHLAPEDADQGAVLLVALG